MDIRSYQARAQAAAGNYQPTISSSEGLGRQHSISNNLMTANMAPQFSTTNVMQPYRPTAAVAPSQAQPVEISRPNYFKEGPASNIAQVKPYQVTENRNAFQSSMSFPYDYRPNDPRGTPPNPSSIYSTPPPTGAIYPPNSQNRSKINSTATGFFSSPGMTNGYDQRSQIYNGDHKPHNSSDHINDNYPSRDSMTPESDLSRLEKDTGQKDNTPSPKQNGVAFQSENLNSSDASQHTSPSDPFNPKNRIMIPPPMPNEKGYIKQNDAMLPINAPKTPSPLVNNGMRAPGYPPNPHRAYGPSPMRALPPGKHGDYSYGLPTSGMFSPQMPANGPMGNGVPRKPMGPPPSPNQSYQQNRANSNIQSYGGYPVNGSSSQNPQGAMTVVGGPGAHLNSSNATPSPTLNQLLTNTHPSQYKQQSGGERMTANDQQNIPGGGHPGVGLNIAQQQQSSTANSISSENSNDSEHQQLNEFGQGQMPGDMGGFMPSPSPSATSVSSLQEEESISSTHAMKTQQMSPQVINHPNGGNSQSMMHSNLPPPPANSMHGPPPPHHMYPPHPHHHPAMISQMQGQHGQMMHQTMGTGGGQYNGTGPPTMMQQTTGMRAPAPQMQQNQGTHSTTNNSSGSSGKDDERIDHFLYSLPFGQEPGRKEFCDRLIKILETRGLIQSKVPCVAKLPVDLFRLYNLVKEKSGFATVCTQKLWKDIANTMDLNNSPMASYNMKKHYTKFLLPYECQYDLNGADPAAVQAECDAPPPRKRPPKQKPPKEEGGRGKKSKSSQNNSNISNPPAQNPGPDDMNGHTINVCDPFSDEFANNQRPGSRTGGVPNAVQLSPPSVPPGYFPKPQFRQPYEAQIGGGPSYVKSYPAPDNAPPIGTVSPGGYPGAPSFRPSYIPPPGPMAVPPVSGAPAYNPPIPPTLQAPPPMMSPPQAASPYQPGVNRVQPPETAADSENGFPPPVSATVPAPSTLQPRRNSAFNMASETVPYPYPSSSGHKEPMPPTPIPPITSSSGASVNNLKETVEEQPSTSPHTSMKVSTTATEVEDTKPVEEIEKSSKKSTYETEYFMEEKTSYWRDSIDQNDFESSCTEATEVVCKPNTRVPAIYVNHGDANKILMSLKSGLKVETNWALETLTVILFDDVTMHHLNIDSLPGIIDVLLGNLQINLDKLSTRHLSEIKESNCSTLPKNENFESTPKKSNIEMSNEASNQKPKNGITTPDIKINERKRKYDNLIEVADDDIQLDSCEAKKHIDAVTESSRISNLEMLSRLKAMSLTKSDRDVSSYNCLHGEILDSLRQQRIHVNGIKGTSAKSNQRRELKSAHIEDSLSESCETFRCEQLIQADIEEIEHEAQTVLSITNIFRSFSCQPSNENRLAGHSDLLNLCSRMIQFAHWHPPKQTSRQKREVNWKMLPDDWESVYLNGIRENCIVLLSNIASKINLDNFDEKCVFSLMDALTHWLVCKSCVSSDPVPGAIHSTITMKRLALETLCKMCLAYNNTDYLLATPPASRISELVAVLLDMVSDSSQPAIRELALVLLTYLSKSDIGVCHLCNASHFVNKVLEYLKESVNLIAKSGFNTRTSNPTFTSSSPSLSGQLFDPSANLFMARSCSSLLLRISQLNPKILLPYRKQLLFLSTSEVFAAVDTREVYANMADILFELNS